MWKRALWSVMIWMVLGSVPAYAERARRVPIPRRGAEPSFDAICSVVTTIPLVGEPGTARDLPALKDYCAGRRERATERPPISAAAAQEALRKAACAAVPRARRLATTGRDLESVRDVEAALSPMCGEAPVSPASAGMFELDPVIQRLTAPDAAVSPLPKRELLGAIQAFESRALRAGAESVENTPSATISAGSLESVIVYGIASVLASRAKAELQVYALDRIRDVACRDGHAIWFANTCAYLAAGDGNELPVVFGPGLRTALATDLKELPRHLISNMPAKLSGTGEQLLAVLFVEAVKLLVEQADPYVIAHQMVALTASGDDGFVCQAAGCRTVSRAVGLAGAALLAALKADAPDRGPAIRAVLRTATPTVTITDEQLARLDAAIEESIRHAEALARAKDNPTRLAEVKPLVQAIVDGIDVLLEVGGSSAALPRGLPELVDGLARGELTAIVVAAVTVFKTLPGAEKLNPAVLRLISFAAELTQAKTSEDAAAAIEAVTAPVGSYRLKGSGPMVSLSGFVGVASGWELLSSARLGAGDNARSGIVAPVAMLGVDFSRPTGIRQAPDVGVFFSVLDLGSLMSYRWSSDPITVSGANGSTAPGSVSNTSVVGFAQVLSPGVFGRVRIGGSPIVATFGAAFVPQARKIDDAMGTTDASAVRLSASLSIDVTLLPFHL